jgi:hypothetical protein
MPDTVSVRFLKAFDPSVKDHVAWLKKVTDSAEALADASKPQYIISQMKENPMNVTFSHSEALDWPHVHFCLCAAYTRAVFNLKAWVPQKV